MPSNSIAATRKQQQTRQMSEALRSFVIGYKGWFEDALQREKLTLPQLRLLRALEENQGESAAAVARSLQVTPQTLQTMLQRAVRERWIVRSHSAANQRILTATLTARGEAVLAKGKALATQFEQQVWAGVSVGTLQQCTQSLRRGLANMDRIRAAATPELPRQRPARQTVASSKSRPR